MGKASRVSPTAPGRMMRIWGATGSNGASGGSVSITSCWLDSNEHIAFLHYLTVGRHKLDDTTRYFSLNLVENLHCLYQRDNLASLHHIANGDKRRRRG